MCQKLVSLHSQLFGHLPHFPLHVHMVLLENYLVHTSQPLKSGKPRAVSLNSLPQVYHR